jgi:hypothetical protein
MCVVDVVVEEDDVDADVGVDAEAEEEEEPLLSLWCVPPQIHLPSV